MKVTTIAIAALVTVVGMADAKELTLKGSNSDINTNMQLIQHRGLENKGKGEGPEGLPSKANTIMALVVSSRINRPVTIFLVKVLVTDKVLRWAWLWS